MDVVADEAPTGAAHFSMYPETELPAKPHSTTEATLCMK
jgi:hypothetical protein